jgi:hypothetical protein
VDRVVADAASLSAQSALLGSLRNAGAEITLDTRIAELREPGSYVSAQWLRSVDRTHPTGLAIVAFGATGAIAHGVSERERFDVRPWLGPRKPGGGGQSGSVYLPALDRYFKIDEARVLREVRGARRLLPAKSETAVHEVLTILSTILRHTSLRNDSRNYVIYLKPQRNAGLVDFWTFTLHPQTGELAKRPSSIPTARK